MFFADHRGQVPGFAAARETYDGAFRWARDADGVIVGLQLDGAARDLTNSPTTLLRPGLLLGQVAATGRFVDYSATATDGSNFAAAVLLEAVRAQDFLGSDQPKWVAALVAGPVKAANLYGLDYVARKQMRGRFLFDDDLGNRQSYVGHQREVVKAASYTVIASDAGTLFTTLGAAGAVTFTLPALLPGLGPFEFLNLADQNMIVASAAGDDVVYLNDLSADSLAFQTAGQKVGGRLRFVANAAGTKWLVEKLSEGTVTVAT